MNQRGLVYKCDISHASNGVLNYIVYISAKKVYILLVHYLADVSRTSSNLSSATYAMQTTFVCKLQFGPSDQHPRGGAQGRGRGDLQKCDYPIQGRVQIVKLLHPPCRLDVDPMARIGVFIVCIRRWFA